MKIRALTTEGAPPKKGSQQLEAFSRKDIKNELKQDGNPSLLSKRWHWISQAVLVFTQVLSVLCRTAFCSALTIFVILFIKV